MTTLRRRVLPMGEMVVVSWRVAKGARKAVRVYLVEVLRQATILGVGSAGVVLMLVFAFGLVMGIESTYAAKLIGAPSLSALGPAIGSLREMTPYAFAYMMAAKVSTGYVAEIGTMRITEEIDALDVMGIDSPVYLGSTRLLATWLVVPLMYAFSLAVGFAASYLATVVQLGQVSAGGWLQLFWEFQSPPDLIFSVVKAMLMASFVVLVGVFFGYTVRGGPAEVGRGHRSGDGREPDRHPRDRPAHQPGVLGPGRRVPDRRVGGMRSAITRSPALALAVAALCLGLVALLLVLRGGDAYVIHAHFANAGGLVEGGRVTVAARPVGSISEIDLTPHGQADVELSIDDDAVAPLREGTRAVIRAVGQSTVSNNYVELRPGLRSRPTIPDGGVLPTTQTSGVVPIDALLDSFGPAERRNFAAFIRNSSEIYAGSGSRSFNRMLARLDPALAEMSAFVDQLDRAPLRALARSAATAARAVASRRDDLRSSVPSMATAFGALADRREALDGALARLPSFLTRARGTLRRTRSTMVALRPALRAVPAAAGPLRALLARSVPALTTSRPVVDELQRQLPDVDRALNGLVRVERPTVAAIRSLGPAMKAARPLLEGLRYYGTDMVVGLLGSLVARTTAEYNHLGHYVKVNYIQSPQTTVQGQLSQLLSRVDLLGVLKAATVTTRRCPGGSAPPAPDGSSPWDLGPRLCTHAQDMTAGVNEP